MAMYNTQKGRELHGKATKGEWFADGGEVWHIEDGYRENSLIADSDGLNPCFKVASDANFTITVHNDFPAIMDELDALRAENAELKDAFMKAREHAAQGWDIATALKAENGELQDRLSDARRWALD
jgi:hypothetical protein